MERVFDQIICMPCLICMIKRTKILVEPVISSSESPTTERRERKNRIDILSWKLLSQVALCKMHNGASLPKCTTQIWRFLLSVLQHDEKEKYTEFALRLSKSSSHIFCIFFRTTAWNRGELLRHEWLENSFTLDCGVKNVAKVSLRWVREWASESEKVKSRASDLLFQSR